jgi:hypothetical protein
MGMLGVRKEEKKIKIAFAAPPGLERAAPSAMQTDYDLRPSIFQELIRVLGMAGKGGRGLAGVPASTIWQRPTGSPVAEQCNAIDLARSASDLAAFEAGAPHAGAHPFDNQVAFEFGDGADDDREHSTPARLSLTRVQFVDCALQLFKLLSSLTEFAFRR